MDNRPIIGNYDKGLIVTWDKELYRMYDFNLDKKILIWKNMYCLKYFRLSYYGLLNIH